MVVEPGLLHVEPAEEPDVELLPSVEQHRVALVWVVVDMGSPEGGLASDSFGKEPKLVRGQVSVVRHLLVEPGCKLSVGGMREQLSHKASSFLVLPQCLPE